MTPRALQRLPMPTGESVLNLLPRLAEALDGGPAIAPVSPDSAAGATVLHPDDDDPDDPTVIVLATSGSTGEPKQVLLPAGALRASAAATEERLGGPGGWLLALPTWHIAGLQVLLRAAGSRTPVAVLESGIPFTAAGFAEVANGLDADRRYVSLVPTQLHRILDDAAATRALEGFDAVLVGGAATAPQLLERARAAGLRIVTTYGMSETCGGCVYDGIPLPGARVELDAGAGAGAGAEAGSGAESVAEGRIRLSGPMVARGYRGVPDHPAFRRPGSFVTDDLGRLDDGVLSVLGRADDMIVTGGFKVPPAAVERALAAVPGIGEVLVVGVPDAEWGQRVVGVVTGVVPTDDAAAAALAGLPGYYRPRRWVHLPAIPLRGPGKPDRAAAARSARSD